MNIYRILIVEDDEHVLDLLGNVLITNGYEIESARSGSEALKKLEEFIPDMIISDVMMPQMSGFELIRRVQQSERTKGIPFLFLTARTEIQDRVEGLTIGANDYISKPFVIAELLARIKTHLHKREALLSKKQSDKGTMEGDLSVFPVVDLIQILKLEKKTGEITLNFQDEKGKIRMNDGEVVDAAFGNATATKAFRALLQQEEGWFSFRATDHPAEITIHQDTQELIVETAKQIDEYRFLLSQLPAPHHVYRISDLTSEVVLTEVAQRILYLFDGQTTLGEVITNSSYESEQTVRTIKYLMDEQFIERVKPMVQKQLICQDSAFNQLSHQKRNLLLSLFKQRKGIPSIVIIGLKGTDVELFITKLCGTLPNETEMDAYKLIHKSICRKVILDSDQELNLYGLQDFRQFTFLWHILGQDILGLFLLAENAQVLQQPPATEFFKTLRSTYQVPCMTILLTQDKENPELELTAKTVPEKFSQIMFYDLDSQETISYIFEQWLEIIHSFYSSQ